MRRTLALLGLLSVGCSTPTNPGPAKSEPVVPIHHNIPATDDSGTIWYLCETQPRRYSSGWERDHYIQRQPCPTVPIQ